METRLLPVLHETLRYGIYPINDQAEGSPNGAILCQPRPSAWELVEDRFKSTKGAALLPNPKRRAGRLHDCGE